MQRTAARNNLTLVCSAFLLVSCLLWAHVGDCRAPRWRTAFPDTDDDNDDERATDSTGFHNGSRSLADHTLGEDRAYPEDTDTETDSDTDYGDGNATSTGTLASEGSRSVGGGPVSPPAWLAYAMLPDLGEGEDLFSGFLIRLNDRRVIAHLDTCYKPQIAFDKDLEKNTEQVVLTPPAQINAMEPQKCRYRLIGCQLGDGTTGLSHGFGVHNLRLERGHDSLDHVNGAGKLTSKPVLQYVKGVKDNCFVYSYSGSTDPNAPRAGHERRFTKFAVDFAGCKGHKCKFGNRAVGGPKGSSKAGRICPFLVDRGAPILCGLDQKLSYLVTAQSDTECVTGFDAIQIADHYDQLTKYLDETPRWPPIDPSVTPRPPIGTCS